MSSTLQRPWTFSSISAGMPQGGGWIINRHADLLLITGPVLFGYLFLYLHISLGVSSFLIWWFWQAAFNGQHIFATISRTYCDKEEWRTRKPLLLGSIALIFSIPLALVIDELTGTKIAGYAILWLNVSWAYYHGVRQHYGLFCIYQKKNGEISGHRNKSEYWIFNIAMLGTFVAWILLWFQKGRALHSPSLNLVVDIAYYGVGALIFSAVALYIVKSYRAAREGKFNFPKTLFFLSYFSLPAVIIFFMPTQYALDLLLVNAVITFPHDIQYMTIVWNYNKKRYRATDTNYGLASYLAAKWWRYAIVSVLFGLFIYYLNRYFAGIPVPFMSNVSPLAHFKIGTHHTFGDLAMFLAIGVGFNHYYLDQRIWRINSDAKVAKNLGLAAA